MEILLVLILIPITGIVLYVLVCIGISLPYHVIMIKRHPIHLSSKHHLDDVIKALEESGKSGWELAEETQKIVSKSMVYSRRNGWDTWKQAFRRGMGYCLQQAEVLKYLLTKLGFSCRIVQGMKNQFPPRTIHEYTTQGGICGHAWVRVTWKNETKDLCPGAPDNRPGVIHFEILSPVTNYSGIMKILGHLGSIMMNTLWDLQAKKALRKK